MTHDLQMYVHAVSVGDDRNNFRRRLPDDVICRGPRDGPSMENYTTLRGHGDLAGLKFDARFVPYPGRAIRFVQLQWESSVYTSTQTMRTHYRDVASAVASVAGKPVEFAFLRWPYTADWELYRIPIKLIGELQHGHACLRLDIGKEPEAPAPMGSFDDLFDD